MILIFLRFIIMSMICAVVKTSQKSTLKDVFNETSGFTIRGNKSDYNVIKNLYIDDQKAMYEVKNSSFRKLILTVTLYSDENMKNMFCLKKLENQPNLVPYYDLCLRCVDEKLFIFLVSQKYDKTIDSCIKTNSNNRLLEISTKRKHSGDDNSVKYVFNINKKFDIDFVLYQKQFKQVLEAIKHFHAENICHRNLKSSNIYIQDGNLVIFGFEHARKLDKGPKEFKRPCALIDTPPDPTYIEYKYKFDIWSIGVVFLEYLLNDKFNIEKFSSKTFNYRRKIKIEKFSYKDIKYKILSHYNANRDHISHAFYDALFDVFTKCFKTNYHQRFDADQLLEMKFFKKNFKRH